MTFFQYYCRLHFQFYQFESQLQVIKENLSKGVSAMPVDDPDKKANKKEC